MNPPGGGNIDAPGTIDQGTTSFEITVDSDSTSVWVTTDNPQSSTEYEVGEDGKVTVDVPDGTTTATGIFISDRNPPDPSSALVEVVSAAH